MPDLSQLDASAAALLAAFTATAPPSITTLSPEQVRAGYLASAAALSGPGESVAETADDVIAGVPVRRYVPEGARGTGVVVYAHGGGWVLGTLDTYDTLCRALANRTGAQVVSVGYALAPEARHPHQVHEVEAVLTELTRGGGSVALAGDSAGAHIAALVAARASGTDIDLRALAMLYPVIAPVVDSDSRRDLASGFMLTAEAMAWYGRHYVPSGGGDGGVPLDLREVDLASLPPTVVVVAGHDPLRDEGLDFAACVEATGTRVKAEIFPGQLHGFARTLAHTPEGFDALGRVGTFLSAELHPGTQ
ncbi:MAG: alpha/beta hydrolase [Sporichthyaceae bacterium]